MILFTPAEAEDVCEDFSDLVDTEFRMEGTGLLLVEHVTICPYAPAARDEYIERFAATGQLPPYTATGDCDVLIIASDNTGQFYYFGIRDFAGSRGVNYQFPGA